jgi:hypothetical protein
MFNIDWKEIGRDLSDLIVKKINENYKNNLILKMKYDSFLIFLSQGDDYESAWQKVEKLTNFFENKIK